MFVVVVMQLYIIGKEIKIFLNKVGVCLLLTLCFVPWFLTRELRACARASYRYDMGNGIRSLDWSIPVNFF